MSWVDNVVLSFDILEDEAARMAEINDWLKKEARQWFWPELPDDTYGGAKCLETPLYIAAFNYLPEERFLEFLSSLPWRFPQHVQFIVKRQNDDVFSICGIVSPEAP